MNLYISHPPALSMKNNGKKNGAVDFPKKRAILT